jgi:hypothetical protein
MHSHSNVPVALSSRDNYKQSHLFQVFKIIHNKSRFWLLQLDKILLCKALVWVDPESTIWLSELGYEVEYFFGSGQDLVVSASSLFESVADGNSQTFFGRNNNDIAKTFI